jgi:GNAT superfamily N-acetyltransferase
MEVKILPLDIASSLSSSSSSSSTWSPDLLLWYIVNAQAFAANRVRFFGAETLSAPSEEILKNYMLDDIVRIAASSSTSPSSTHGPLDGQKKTTWGRAVKAIVTTPEDGEATFTGGCAWIVHSEEEPFTKSVEEAVNEVLVAMRKVPEARIDALQAVYTSFITAKREILGVQKLNGEDEDGEQLVSKFRKHVEVKTLFTDPKYQGKGLGKAMVIEALKEADHLGLETYIVSSVYGRPLYEKVGFVAVKEINLDLGEFGCVGKSSHTVSLFLHVST